VNRPEAPTNHDDSAPAAASPQGDYDCRFCGTTSRACTDAAIAGGTECCAPCYQANGHYIAPPVTTRATPAQTGKAKPVRAKGHALTMTWSGEYGAESSSTGECKCGWTESASNQREVRFEYRCHLARLARTSPASASTPPLLTTNP
jgi:hypothetical protein